MRDLRVTVVWGLDFIAAFSRMDICGPLVDGDAPDPAHVRQSGGRRFSTAATGMGFEVLPMDVVRFPVYVEQLSFPHPTARVRTSGTTASARQFGSQF
jgi:hypothetical protein